MQVNKKIDVKYNEKMMISHCFMKVKLWLLVDLVLVLTNHFSECKVVENWLLADLIIALEY